MHVSTIQLFLVFLKVGAFTFGGGYAMIPIFERELVHRYKLVKPDAFYDMLVVCQSLPGAIAINFSVFLGLKLRGLKGALAGFLGVVLPSFLFMLVIAIFLFRFVDYAGVEAFFKGVRLSVVALMFLAGWKLLQKQKSWFGIFVIALTLGLLIGFNTHPIIIVVVAGLFGLCVYWARGVIEDAS